MTRLYTQLCDDPAELQEALEPAATTDVDAVLLLTLGFAAADFVPFARRFAADTPVLLADCYGVLGFSRKEGRNLEFMEAGRGQEYGGVGGDGGLAIVATVFSKGMALASIDDLPGEGVTSHLVIASQTANINALLTKQASAIYYGGLAKATYRYLPEEERFAPVPQICISTLAAPDRLVGTTSFTADAEGALQTLLDQAPKGSRVDAVALFPCFMRGKNEYGRNNVEPDVVSNLLPKVPIFGMFCHGELGPSRCLGFNTTEKPQNACIRHSGASIVALHARVF